MNLRTFHLLKRLAMFAAVVSIPTVVQPAAASSDYYRLWAEEMDSTVEHECVQVTKPSEKGTRATGTVSLLNRCDEDTESNDQMVTVEALSCEPLDCTDERVEVPYGRVEYVGKEELELTEQVHDEKVREGDELEGELLVRRGGEIIGTVNFVAHWVYNDPDDGCGFSIYPCC